MSEFKIKLAPPDIDIQLLEASFGNFGENAADPAKALYKFESAVKAYTGATASLALNSGTSALHLALLALGIEEGDDVLCPSFTFVATLNAICYLKANPVIIDSELETWNICPIALRKAIEQRILFHRKPKALILVHTYGMSAKIDEILMICQEFNIKLIEDAAGALGSTYKGKALGTIGDVGIFSFNYNKILTTGGGGMLITKHHDLREKAAYLSTQAKTKKPYYFHEQIGYNYQMNGMAASLGMAQMNRLDERISRKREIYELYRNNLEGIELLSFQDELEGSFSNRWLTTLLFKDAELSKRVHLSLQSSGIETRPLWYPMHLQPVFKKYTAFVNQNSEYLFQHGLALPSGTGISNNEITYVADKIVSCLVSIIDI